MSKDLHGFIACVTGGARGLGASIVRTLAKNGAHVIIADILSTEGKSLAFDLRNSGLRASFEDLNVGQEESWQTLTDNIAAQFGQLDILVNNAAIIIRKRLSQLTLQEWHAAMKVNVDGVFLGIKSCRPLLKRSQAAAIVNVSSTAGIIAHLDPSYTTSKWAVRGFTKSAALELIQEGIRVNSVHPSMIDTPLTAAGPPGHIEANRHAIPMGRGADPQEIANVVYFLSSPQSSYMTGSEVVVDGGMTTAGVPHMRAQFQQHFNEQKEG